MGHAQRSNRAQLLPKRKPSTRNEIQQLREENRQLRELVAHLSKLAIARIAEAAQSEEEQAG
jgi:hypothetical protein